MISWLQKILIEKFASSWLAKLVAKFNGLKVIFGVLLVALGEFLKVHPTYGPYINLVIELIKPFASTVTDAGIIAVIIGAVHKAEKWIVWLYTWISTGKRPPLLDLIS